MRDRTRDWLRREFEKLPERKSRKNIIDVAEEHRIVSGAFPGLYSYSRTPYMYEPASLLSPQSQFRQITIMAAAQSGKTAGVIENFLLFCTELGQPSNALYMTATENLAKEFVQERVDPMYNNAEIYFTSDQTLSGGLDVTKKTGNTTFKKTGKGWTHVFKSFGNIREVRSIDYRVILLDEVDEMQQKQSQHNQGSIIKIAEARTRSYAGREKIVLCSTPILAKSSIIYEQFQKSDQRYCYIPCPYCKHEQHLEFKNLKWKFLDKDRTKVDRTSVYYECEKNKCKIKNADKATFLTLENVKWKAHNKTGQDGHAGFHFSALYCPPGMTAWEQIAQDFIDSKNSVDDLQAFTNLTLGIPFHDTQAPQSAESLNSLKEPYKSNTIPRPDTQSRLPILATMGVDVQGDRIEYELVGHAPGYHTWSLSYGVLKGDTSSYSNSVWIQFKDMLIHRKLVMQPKMIFIDSSFQTQEIRALCSGTKSLRPIMGVNTLHGDKIRRRYLKGFVSYDGTPIVSYDIDTTSYKRTIYKNLLLRRDENGIAPAGFCRFPIDYNIKYFRGLQSEVQEPQIDKRTGKIKGYLFVQRGRRNEPLDCRVYALAALDALALENCEYNEMKTTDFNFFWENVKKKNLES